MDEPITKCGRCAGEGVDLGPEGEPTACARCHGTGLLAVTRVASCRCGLIYNTRTWERLALVGEQRDDVEVLELRNCRCGSTLAIVVERIDEERSVA